MLAFSALREAFSHRSDVSASSASSCVSALPLTSTCSSVAGNCSWERVAGSASETSSKQHPPICAIVRVIETKATRMDEQSRRCTAVIDNWRKPCSHAVREKGRSCSRSYGAIRCGCSIIEVLMVPHQHV